MSVRSGKIGIFGKKRDGKASGQRAREVDRNGDVDPEVEKKQQQILIKQIKQQLLAMKNLSQTQLKVYVDE